MGLLLWPCGPWQAKHAVAFCSTGSLARATPANASAVVSNAGMVMRIMASGSLVLRRMGQERGDVFHVLIAHACGLRAHRRMVALARAVRLECTDDVLVGLPAELRHVVRRVDVRVALDAVAAHAGAGFHPAFVGIT